MIPVTSSAQEHGVLWTTRASVGGGSYTCPMEMEELLSQIGRLAHEAARQVQGSTVHLSQGRLTADVAALQQVIAAATAAQTVRIAQFAARDEQRREDGTFVEVDRGLGHVSEFASDTLAPMLAMSFGPAAKRVRTAAKLAAQLPRTMRALAGAKLDPFRAQIIAEELLLAGRDTCTAVEQLIHPDVEGDTPAQVRRRVRKALAEVDPDAVAERAARARLERFVLRRASDIPGITEWWAQLPAEDSAKCWAAIDALAHRRRQDDPSLRLEQCRADALVDLILGNATVETSLTLVLPVDTIPDPASETPAPPAADASAEPDTQPDCGHDDVGDEGDSCDDHGDEDDRRQDDGQGNGRHGDDRDGKPAGDAQGDPRAHVDPKAPQGNRISAADVTGVAVPGIGVIPASVVLSMAGVFDAATTRMLIDSRTGVTMETSASTYRPPTAIARHVRLRDRTCRFPGCGIRSERCELDHLIPWPLGPTAVHNLLCLCKHHHRLKHHTRWRVRPGDKGAFVWTDPFGQAYLVRPPDHRQLAAA